MNIFTWIKRLFCRKAFVHKTILYNAEHNNIVLLPVLENSIIVDLFPDIIYYNNTFSIFIIGKSKNYVHVKMTNEFLVNTKDTNNTKDKANLMPDDLKVFLDSVWDTVLKTRHILRLMFIYNEKVYLLYAYCMENVIKKVIGGMAFLIHIHEGINPKTNEGTQQFNLLRA